MGKAKIWGEAVIDDGPFPAPGDVFFDTIDHGPHSLGSEDDGPELSPEAAHHAFALMNAVHRATALGVELPQAVIEGSTGDLQAWQDSNPIAPPQ